MSVFRKHLRGIEVITDKVKRSHTEDSACQQREVILIRGDWNRTFLNERADFGAGQHNDPLDDVSLASSMLK